MRLVEAVIGELRHQLEHLDRLVARDAAPDRALGEDRALRVHLGADLLAHRPAQQVGGAQAVAGHLLRDLHHLLLVDQDPVRLLQDVADLLVRALPRLAVLALAVVGNIGHRTRPVQGARRDQILEPGRPHLTQHVAHPRPFELEHAGGIATRQHLVGAPIVERQGGEVDAHPELAQHLHAALQDRQRGQAEEVELHQPGLLDIFHVVLRDEHVALRIAIQRHQLAQRPVADHHPGGMGAGMAIQPLELQRDLHQPAHRLVAGAHLLQPLLAVDRLTQRHRLGRIVRDQFADLVDHEEWQTQHAADVAHRRARLQLAEGDDLRHPVAAIFAAHIGDHLVATVLAEIDVEIRHRHALRVQEPLEQQPKRDRIDVGDGQRPRRQRSGARAASRTDRNVVRLGPLDEVGDDHEIAGKAHRRDHVQLERQPRAIRLACGLVRPHRRKPGREPLLGHRPQRLFLAAARPHLRTDRQQRLARLGHHRAAPGDRQRVVAGLRQIGEQRPHRLRRLEPLLRRDPPPVALGHGAALGDAQQRIVRLVHLRRREEAFVGRHQRQAEFVGQPDQPRLHRLLDRQPVTLQLDRHTPGKRQREPGQQPARLLLLPIGQQPGERSAGAAGEQE